MLGNSPLFSALSPDELETLSRHVLLRSYRKNTIIVEEGDRADAMYIVESGQVKVFLSDEAGKEIVLNILEPGQYFGELALVDDQPRSASVITTQPSKLMMIARADFEDCMQKNPGIALQVMRGLAQMLRRSTGNVKSLALMDVYGRVARLLMELATEDNGSLAIREKLTHQDIADRVGSSREMITRILKDLKTGGYLDIEGRQITILEKLPSGW